MGQPFSNPSAKGWNSFTFPVVDDDNAATGFLGELQLGVDPNLNSKFILYANTYLMDGEDLLILDTSGTSFIGGKKIAALLEQVTITHTGSLPGTAEAVYIRPTALKFSNQVDTQLGGVLVADLGSPGEVTLQTSNGRRITVFHDPDAATYSPLRFDVNAGGNNPLKSPNLGYGDAVIPCNNGGTIQVSNSGDSAIQIYIDTADSTFKFNNTVDTSNKTFNVGGDDQLGRFDAIFSESDIYFDDTESNPEERFFHRNSGIARDVYIEVPLIERFFKVRYDSAGNKGAKVYLHAGSPFGWEMQCVNSTNADSTIQTSSERLPYSF